MKLNIYRLAGAALLASAVLAGCAGKGEQSGSAASGERTSGVTAVETVDRTVLPIVPYQKPGKIAPILKDSVSPVVDGKQSVTTKLPATVLVAYSVDEGMDIGEDTGSPVSHDYEVPFKFTGAIEKVVIDVKPIPANPGASEAAARMPE